MNRPAALFLTALLVGAVLRLWSPALRPLHHDEGVNVLFMEQLLSRGHYRYDPANYHGPTLYGFAAPVVGSLGWSEAALRLVPVLASMGTLALAWRFRWLLGPWGAAAAAWFLALSPASVYYARDFIHESLLLFFEAALAAYLVSYVERPARSTLVLAALALALGAATKETMAIHVVALGAGAALALGVRDGRKAAGEALRGLRRDPWGLALAALVGLVVFALFMTSLGTNWGGLADFFRSYMFWTRTGVEGVSGHEKPFGYFADLLTGPDRVLGLVGLAGLVHALWRRRASGLFLTGWMVSVFCIYSAVPYKTPWLVLNLLLPLALLAGRLLQDAWRAAGDWRLRAAVASLFVVLLVVEGRGAVDLTFRRFDDDRQPYVYSQTRRELLDLVQAVRDVARLSGRDDQLRIAIWSPEYFPLNYYLMGFRSPGFWSEVVSVPDAHVFIWTTGQQDKALATLEGTVWARSFPLRPGVDLVLGVPEDLCRHCEQLFDGWERLEPAPLPDATAG